MIVIDRESPNGNAFNILGVAVQLMREKGYTAEQAEAVLEEMKSGDYDNLCSVFEQTFCDDVELI
jgi:hypothetical protein